MLTPYQFGSNSPIQAVDLDGLEALHFTLTDGDNGETVIKQTIDWDLPLTTNGVMVTDNRGGLGTVRTGFASFSDYPEQFPNFSQGVFTQADLDARNPNPERKDGLQIFSGNGRAALVAGAAGGDVVVSGSGLGGYGKLGRDLISLNFTATAGLDGATGTAGVKTVLDYGPDELDYKVVVALGPVGTEREGTFDASTGTVTPGSTELINVGPFQVEQNSYGERAYIFSLGVDAGLGLGFEGTYDLRINPAPDQPELKLSESEKLIKSLPKSQ